LKINKFHRRVKFRNFLSASLSDIRPTDRGTTTYTRYDEDQVVKINEPQCTPVNKQTMKVQKIS